MRIGATHTEAVTASSDQQETRYRNIKTCTPTAMSEAAIASTPSIKPTFPSDWVWGVTVTAALEEPEVDPLGFLCKATDAWGNPDLLPAALGGTFAVSFLLSADREAGVLPGTPETDGDFGIAGATDADGITGALGASGGGAANEGGLGTPGGTPAKEGGFGGAGATPGIEGGFGATGGVDKPIGAFGAAGAIPGGFGRGGVFGGSSPAAETDSGTPGFWIGLGGRLIIAVSRGLDGSG